MQTHLKTISNKRYAIRFKEKKMKRNLKKGLVLLGTLVLAVVLLASIMPAQVHAARSSQSGNLLKSPEMESGYAGCGAGKAAGGWKCWWSVIEKPVDASALTYTVQPYFSNETNSRLIHGGAGSQAVGYQLDPWMGGVWQTVTGIPAGSVVQFCMYARLYASNESNDGSRSSISSMNGRARVGIDPNGGDNWASGVTWSGQANPHDTWQQLCIQGTVGAAGKVTVFTSNDYRESAANHLDSWWDDATLTVVGATTPAPGAGSTPGTPPTAAPPPPAPLPSALATPGPDGSIVHTIQSGDTLFALSIAYDVSLDQILTLNNITKDTLLSIDQKIIIRGPTQPAQPTPAPTSTTPEVPPTAAPTATPENAGAKLCVQAFDDTNADGLLTPGEQPVAGVQFTVNNSQGDTAPAPYTSEGDAAPHCFDNLAPGTYSVAVQPAANTLATSDKRWSVSLTGGATVNIRFGSRSSSNAPGNPANPGGTLEPKSTGGSSPSNVLGLLVGLLVLLVAGVLGAFVIARRRA
jgi:LysM repeat protein